MTLQDLEITSLRAAIVLALAACVAAAFGCGAEESPMSEEPTVPAVSTPTTDQGVRPSPDQNLEADTDGRRRRGGVRRKAITNTGELGGETAPPALDETPAEDSAGKAHGVPTEQDMRRDTAENDPPPPGPGLSQPPAITHGPPRHHVPGSGGAGDPRLGQGKAGPAANLQAMQNAQEAQCQALRRQLSRMEKAPAAGNSAQVRDQLTRCEAALDNLNSRLRALAGND